MPPGARALLLLLLLLVPLVPLGAEAQGVQRALLTADATDIVVLSPPTHRKIHVRRLDVQNLGLAKVVVSLCDGTCTVAANVKYSWHLSAATATTQGGAWSLESCSATPCEWVLERALVAQVNLGASSPVVVSVGFYFGE